MGEHASKERDQDIEQPQAREKKGKQPTHARPSAEQVDKLTTEKPEGVVIGDQCVFGDKLVGSTSFCNIQIASSHEVDGADVRVTYDGPRAMQIVSAPAKLHPDVEGAAGWTPLRLAFQPTAEGSFRGALTIDIARRDGTQQQHHVLVAGRAHAEGSPDWDQRDRESIRKGFQAEDQQRRSAMNQAGEQAIDAQNRDTVPHKELTTGQAIGYEAQNRALDLEIARLYGARIIGIDSAKNDALGYRRPVARGEGMPRAARLAIETVSTMASAFLGSVTKEVVEHVVSKMAGEIVGTLVEEGVKKVGDNLVDEKATTRESDADVREFRERQAAQLEEAKYATGHTMIGINARLFPLRTRDPRLATRVLEVLTRAIGTNVERVAQIQKAESSRQWMHYLAQSSLGTSKRDQALSDIGRANIAPSDDKLRAFDGLIDLTFSASATHPQATADLLTAKVTGVTAETLAVLSNQSLLDAGLPIRAAGAPTTDAISPMTVVRDERGNIMFNDSVGEGSQPAHWFERKGGGDPEVGARKVLVEIATEPLGNRLKAE